MKHLKQLLSKEILRCAKDICPEADICENDIYAYLEYPPDKNMGDLAFPCFRLSKPMRMSPVIIAEKISSCLCCEEIESSEPTGGYLNFKLSDGFRKRILSDILDKKDEYGKTNEGKGKTVVIDYSSPNVAKPFHIGHLGTTVIGHSIKKMHEFAGYKCIGINYLGDWGTQFGKLILAYKKWGDREEIEKGGVDKLVDLYVKINNMISDEEEKGVHTLSDESRSEFHKMETGDEENLSLWKWFVDISLKEYKKTYDQLGIEFDSYKGESFYTDKMPAQIELLREKGLLKIDDGASIVDLSEYNMPPCLILKRDGSTLYPTRDIAAAVYRKNEYGFDKAIYVTSAGQSLHFAQWFKVVEMMGYPWYDELVHVPYGTISLNGSKLATRSGNVILLRDLFSEAIDKVREIMMEKNPDIPDFDRVAEEVGVGAVIFYYLSNSRIKDINFVMEEALSFDGNTGPYVQYTYARCCSVLKKTSYADDSKTVISSVYERDLCDVLSKFAERFSQALNEYEPYIISRYIIDVCNAFNRFYHECSILNAEDEQTKNTRLKLTMAVRTVLANAMDLICLKKPEQI